jgi:spore coat polysaccharide biosynthesis predicted glycosyltransferase SpsG
MQQATLGQVRRTRRLARHLNVGVNAVVFCNHELKDEVCKKHGWNIDVWIDDRPESIRET